MVCKRYTRAFLHPLAAKGLPFATNLITYHNIAYMMVRGSRIGPFFAAACHVTRCIAATPRVAVGDPTHPSLTQHVHLCLPSPALQRLSQQIRDAIREQRYPAFVREYVARQYPAGDYPEWVVEGCRLAGIELGSSGGGSNSDNNAAVPAATADAIGSGGSGLAAAAAADGSRQSGAAADSAG